MTSSRNLRVIVAPTAFKGTLSPSAAARAMTAGVRRVWPQARVIERPLSDGGNGLLEVCRALLGGTLHKLQVTGPLGDRVPARLLVGETQAVVESAEACGLHLVPREKRDPARATTRGVGELLSAAATRGASELILGLGGSATVDGGTGMARALGWRFVDSAGLELPEGGGALDRLVDLIPPEHGYVPHVTALCDVANPLLGREGAAAVYGPQKGANPEEVELLERGLRRLHEVVGRRLNVRLDRIPGGGAAGGLGAGARAFLDAELVSGAEWMMERAGVREELGRAELLVTGEGKFDAQSGMGKLTGRLLLEAAEAGVPVVLVAGHIEGRLPGGVTGIDGGGTTLTATDLTRLAQTACRRLARGDRL